MKSLKAKAFLLFIALLWNCDSPQIEPKSKTVFPMPDGVLSKAFVSVDRTESMLSAGANSGRLIADTIKVVSNIEWTLINGSPTQFDVQKLQSTGDTTLLAISTMPNLQEFEKIGKLVIYGDNIELHEITLRQQPGTRLYNRVGSNELGYQDGNLSLAKFDYIWAMSYDVIHNTLYVADHNNSKIRKVDLTNQAVTTLPGTYGNLYGVSSDIYGDVYLGGSRLFFHKISPDGTVTTLNWDNEESIGVLSTPTNSNGPIYYLSGNKILKVDRGTNEASLFAGAESAGFSDGEPLSARFDSPMALCTAPDGGLYVLDNNNIRIRHVSIDGIASTLIGGQRGYLDGPLTRAQIWAPTAITVANTGTIYFIDGGYEIRKITSDKVVSTLELINDAPQNSQYTAIHAYGNTVFVSTVNKIYIFDAE